MKIKRKSKQETEEKETRRYEDSPHYVERKISPLDVAPIQEVEPFFKDMKEHIEKYYRHIFTPLYDLFNQVADMDCVRAVRPSYEGMYSRNLFLYTLLNDKVPKLENSAIGLAKHKVASSENVLLFLFPDGLSNDSLGVLTNIATRRSGELIGYMGYENREEAQNHQIHKALDYNGVSEGFKVYGRTGNYEGGMPGGGSLLLGGFPHFRETHKGGLELTINSENMSDGGRMLLGAVDGCLQNIYKKINDRDREK